MTSCAALPAVPPSSLRGGAGDEVIQGHGTAAMDCRRLRWALTDRDGTVRLATLRHSPHPRTAAASLPNRNTTHSYTPVRRTNTDYTGKPSSPSHCTGSPTTSVDD